MVLTNNLAMMIYLDGSRLVALGERGTAPSPHVDTLSSPAQSATLFAALLVFFGGAFRVALASLPTPPLYHRSAFWINFLEGGLKAYSGKSAIGG